MNKILAISGLCLSLAYASFGVYDRSIEVQAKKEALFNLFFNACISNIGFNTPKEEELYYRRGCGVAAKAYADGKKDYVAFNKEYTFDEQLQIYVTK